jgi:RNA methyltransferase, TrmH family
MLSSSKIKWIKALSQKKIRRHEGLFIAEGEKIVRELLDSKTEIAEIFSTVTKNEKEALKRGIPFQLITPGELERISSLTTPNTELAIVRIPEPQNPQYPSKGHFTLVLDNIQDPGNLGTIIRTAEWFGIHDIVCSPDTADVYNPKVIQATMGSFIRINISYAPLSDYLSKTGGELPVMGALLEGENLYKTNLPEEGILIIGNESKGISKEIIPFINKKLFIPRGSKNTSALHPESLNASVAASVILAALTN